MAKWRAVYKDISTSGQVNQLTEFEKLLFTWMIPHADDWGVLTADPEEVRLKVVPGIARQLQEIADALWHIEAVGLIWLYQPEGYGALAQFRKWDTHQHIRKERRTDPRHPTYDETYPRPTMTDNDGQSQAKTAYTTPYHTTLHNTKKSGKATSRKRDARLDHKSIIAYKELARLHVPIALRDDWIACAEEVGTEHLLAIVKEWLGKGHKPQNVSGMMDVARSGWQHGTHKQGRKRSGAANQLDPELQRKLEQLSK